MATAPAQDHRLQLRKAIAEEPGYDCPKIVQGVGMISGYGPYTDLPAERAEMASEADAVA
jgi:hypothetical protein